jgi:8-oxo-dGTP pyrophosphatase MutT (NUDIX family)
MGDAGNWQWQGGSLLARLRSGLAAGSTPAAVNGDHLVAGLPVDEALLAAAVPAAVLVPIVQHEAGPTLLLTRRSAALRKHSGQIAFPGGRIDAGDAGPVAAALREAEEEVGLSPATVEVQGLLPAYLTGTGYHVTPVVALLPPGLALSLNPQEVDAAFEVPLAFALDEANHERRSAVWQGRERHFFALVHGEHLIWGATAGIIRLLRHQLLPPELAGLEPRR